MLLITFPMQERANGMSIFKNATEVFIPDSVLNTEAWISDSELLNAFYDIDVATQPKV